MVSRAKKKRLKETRKHAEKRYHKHLRHNRIYARPGIHHFVIILDHLKPNFNIGKIFRTAEAFGANSVHLIGTSSFDTRAAKGAFKWVPVAFHDTFESCYTALLEKGYHFFLLDPGAQSALHTTELPIKSCFIFGHEEFGISFEHECYALFV